MRFARPTGIPRHERHAKSLLNDMRLMLEPLDVLVLDEEQQILQCLNCSTPYQAFTEEHPFPYCPEGCNADRRPYMREEIPSAHVEMKRTMAMLFLEAEIAGKVRTLAVFPRIILQCCVCLRAYTVPYPSVKIPPFVLLQCPERCHFQGRRVQLRLVRGGGK